MAGRIKAEDIAVVKERSSLEDIVREHVTLRQAGIGSLKGLCPFHDEKTPSFHIRPVLGTYHCFGCQESGDVISFLQAIEHLSFTEAVEVLAAKLGLELRYEDGGRRDEIGTGRRQRLLDAHRVAEEFYTAALLDRARRDARVGRDFLREKGFDSEAARHFGVGFAPRGGDDLARHLRNAGFSAEELVVAGLAAQGQRGLYDKFRGRVVWPIRDITGSTVGFGARRLFDDDRMPAKYLNTAETPLYKKSQVLYGLDLAKKSMATRREAVVVEGYTDVMAAHLSGVTTAVATSGTAFGIDHIKVLRRILRDELDLAPARVVFTFDGDAAGQKAAMRAFAEDQRWASQSFVAVAPDGMDPCDLRLARGPDAVATLVAEAVPMFEFAVRTTVARFPLDSVEGRVLAARAVAPIVAGIRDDALRPEYTRAVAGWVGVDEAVLRDEVLRAGRQTSGRDRAQRAADALDQAAADGGPAGRPPEEDDGRLPMPDLRDPIQRAERQLLQAVLQYRHQFSDDTLAGIPVVAMVAPAHAAVVRGVHEVLPESAGLSSAGWVSAIAAAAGEEVRALVNELSVAPLPTRLDPETALPPQRYLDALVRGVHDTHLGRRIADLTATVRHLQHDPHAAPETVAGAIRDLHALERARATMREEAMQ